MLCNICQIAFKLFPWSDNGQLLPDIHHSTSEELYHSAQLGCRICSALKERWDALARSLSHLSLGPKAGRGLVSCFFYKLPIERPDGQSQSEALHVKLFLDLMDVGREIPEEERSVGFILIPPGGSYCSFTVKSRIRILVQSLTIHTCRIS